MVMLKERDSELFCHSVDTGALEYERKKPAWPTERQILVKIYLVASFLDLSCHFHTLTLFMMAHFEKASSPKICQTYPSMVKLATVISHLKKIQKRQK